MQTSTLISFGELTRDRAALCPTRFRDELLFRTSAAFGDAAKVLNKGEHHEPHSPVRSRARNVIFLAVVRQMRASPTRIQAPWPA